MLKIWLLILLIAVVYHFAVVIWLRQRMNFGLHQRPIWVVVMIFWPWLLIVLCLAMIITIICFAVIECLLPDDEMDYEMLP